MKSTIWALLIFAGAVRADSGWSWLNPQPTGGQLIAGAALDGNNVVVAGNFGAILRSRDGGATWTQQPSGTTATLNAVCFTDPNTGTVVGANGTILRTTDGGATWTSQWPAAFYSFTAVSFTDAYTGTVVGANFSGNFQNSGRILDHRRRADLDLAVCRRPASLWSLVHRFEHRNRGRV
jgi:photosystem II stability/assembly factor-like uncharacterized protein